MRPSLLLIAILSLAACVKPTSYRCEDDAQCGAGNRCEPGGLCSAPAGDCPSGWRYQPTADERAGSCVAGDGPDAGLDASIPPLAHDVCAIGGPLDPASDPCVASVCAHEPRCCREDWTPLCVQQAARQCRDIPDVGRCQAQVSTAAWTYGVGRLEPDDLATSATTYCFPAPPRPEGDDACHGYTAELAWADHDGDGDVDLAAAGPGGLRLHDASVPPAGGPMSFTLEDVIAAPVACAQSEWGLQAALEWRDFDRDGDLDLLWASEGGGVRVVENRLGEVATRAERFRVQAPIVAAPVARPGARFVQADGTGPLEVVAVDGRELTLHGWDPATRQWTPLDAITLADTGTRIEVAWDQVALAGGKVYRAAGGKLVEPVTTASGFDLRWVYLDGDDQVDLVAHTTSIILPMRRAGGALVDLEPIPAEVGWAMAVGDVDGDGQIDLLMRPRSGPFVIYRNQGVEQPAGQRAVLRTERMVAPVDLDDGDSNEVETVVLPRSAPVSSGGC